MWRPSHRVTPGAKRDIDILANNEPYGTIDKCHTEPRRRTPSQPTTTPLPNGRARVGELRRATKASDVARSHNAQPPHYFAREPNVPSTALSPPDLNPLGSSSIEAYPAPTITSSASDRTTSNRTKSSKGISTRPTSP